MTLRLITPPAAEPLSVAEVKELGKIDAGEDSTFELLIKAARKSAEDRTGRALILQTWERVLDAFPMNEIRIGMLPIQSVVSVKYYDPDGVLQTMDAADYVLDVDTMPGWLLPAEGVSWPSTRCAAQSVIVRFQAGYGNTGDDVPAEIKLWIAAQVAAAFRAPEGLMSELATGLPFVDGLLDGYRVFG